VEVEEKDQCQWRYAITLFMSGRNASFKIQSCCTCNTFHKEEDKQDEPSYESEDDFDFSGDISDIGREDLDKIG
jgi:hypothetical protein